MSSQSDVLKSLVVMQFEKILKTCFKKSTEFIIENDIEDVREHVQVFYEVRNKIAKYALRTAYLS